MYFFCLCVFSLYICYCIFLISLILLAGVEFKEFWLFPQLYVAGKTYLKSLFQCFYLENSLCKKSKTVDFAKRSNFIFFEKRNMGKSRISLNSRPAFEFKDFAETKKTHRKHKQEKNIEWKRKKEINEKLNRIKKRKLEELKTRKTQYIYLLFVFSLLSDWWN